MPMQAGRSLLTYRGSSIYHTIHTALRNSGRAGGDGDVGGGGAVPSRLVEWGGDSV